MVDSGSDPASDAGLDDAGLDDAGLDDAGLDDPGLDDAGAGDGGLADGAVGGGDAGGAGSDAGPECRADALGPCNEPSHACRQASCDGVTYHCAFRDGLWAWRSSPVCDDGDPCTFGDECRAGVCAGTPITCASDACVTRACDGTASCRETIHVGAACDDGDACSYGDTCNAAGVCTSLATVSCDAMDTTCVDYSCNGTAICASAPRIGAACDDGDPATRGDTCRADGSCRGSMCSPTLATAFQDEFASPSSSSWSSGTDVPLGASRWRVFTKAQHGLRITGGRLEITNVRSGYPGHGHGYAYVRTGGTGSAYDGSFYDATLANNTDSEVVWSFNMRRDGTTEGGFSCSSTASQNNITVGLAYVLATDDPYGLDASTSTCSSSGAARGYAVVLGGSRRIRLVRFEGGLRNGALTTIVESGNFTVGHYFSVRVTYDARTNQWRLEARSDGSSSFADPAAGSYSFSGTGSDGTLTGIPLEYSGPYFQTGCTGLCTDTLVALFDNVRVGTRCAP